MRTFFATETLMRADRRTRQTTAWPVLLILTVTAAGCDGLLSTSQDYADNAQIVVTGSSPTPMLLILSNRYTEVPDQVSGQVIVQIEAADTFELSLPIDRSYPLGSQYRILARLQNADTTSTASVNMRVLLGGKDEVFNQNAVMKASSLEYRFNYF